MMRWGRVLAAAGALAAMATATGAGPDGAGGEKVECAALVYANGRTAVCFGTTFLRHLNADTTIRAAESIGRARLDDAGDLARYPFVLFSGEGAFTLTDVERANLRAYIERGGFVVASAGCANPRWAESFAREMALVLPGRSFERLPATHLVFRMVYAIPPLKSTSARVPPGGLALQGMTVDGRLAVVFAPEGLNDSAHAANCCCCGGDELENAEYIMANLLAYALLH